MLATVAPFLLSWSVSPNLGCHVSPSAASTTADVFGTVRRPQLQVPCCSGRMLTASAALRSRRCGYHPLAGMASESGIRLPLAAISVGLTTAIESAAEQDMKDLVVAGEGVDLRQLELDEEELEGHRSRLLSELGDVEAAGLIFQTDGAPSPSTLGLTLVLTARRAAELAGLSSVADLVEARENGNQPAHMARASLALATVVSQTLAEMEAAEMEGVQAQSAEDARSMHTRWATLEMARAHYAKDRPADWGSAGG